MNPGKMSVMDILSGPTYPPHLHQLNPKCDVVKVFKSHHP